MTDLVFVYGTLKKGFPNHSINQGVRILGDFITPNSYPLYLVGERYSPWLINDQGHGLQVRGEVYDVAATQIERMDRLERVGLPDGYQRGYIEVQNLQDDRVHSVWVYFKSVLQLEGEQVREGPLACYEIRHAKLYQPRPGKGSPSQKQANSFS